MPVTSKKINNLGSLCVAALLLAGAGCGPADLDSVGADDASLAGPPVNLIANPSFETPNSTRPTQPANWTTAAWGTNTVSFSYVNGDAHTGARSARIDVTNYSTGDAKWIFDAVPASPGTSFVYRDHYKATVTTKLVAAFQAPSGTLNFLTLAAVPPQANWTMAGATFTVPAGTVKVTVYHLIGSSGTLQIDDANLSLPQPADLSTGVPNGNFEQVSDIDLNQPLAWRTSNWGINNPRYTWATGGHGGSRSAVLTVSGYTSGDAKWTFDPQPVTPGTRYLYSDWYLATAQSFLAVRFTMGDGTFKLLPTVKVPPATGYTQAQTAFAAPAGAVAVTVYHGLSQNGTLQTDDVALSVLPATVMVNGVPNGNLEQESYPGANLPAAWYPNVWGTSTSSFSWPAEGHSGTHCARLDVTSYDSGAASWYFDSQPVAASNAYLVTAYYRSSIDFALVAAVTFSNGTSVNMDMPSFSATANWTAYQAKLYLPPNAVSVILYFKVSRVGWMEIDDAGLIPTSTLPFNRALVSITFDDGWITDYTNAFPVLHRHGVPATNYVITGAIDDPDRLSTDMISALMAAGHEIGSHTVNHYDMTTLTAAELDYELSASQQALIFAGFGPARNIASPYGGYDTAVLAGITKYYRSHRTVDFGYNTIDDFDPYRLKIQHIFLTTTPADVDAWAARAVADKSWLILVYHDVMDTDGSPYSTTTAGLDAQISTLQAHGLPFVTIDQGLDEVMSQLPPQ